MQDNPLANLCVVEIGHSLAAPYAAMILCSLGARVVKVENVRGGDPARGWGPPFIDDAAAMFHAVNLGKQSVRADFDDPVSVARLQAFVLEHADVVIQNLKVGSLEKHGLGAEQLRAAKPSLIYCNVGAFGDKGPLKRKPGYDPLVQAYSGMMKLVGNPDDEASRVPVSLNDMGTGMWGAIGLIVALRERDRTGLGTTINVSLYETALAWMTVQITDVLAGGKSPSRLGSGNANIVPYQVFICADDAILVAAGNDGLFRKLCVCLGLDGLAEDVRFLGNGDRVAHRAELIPLLAARFRERNADDWITRLEAVGVPCGPLQSIDDVIGNAQTAALGILGKSPGGVTTVALPLSFDGSRPALPGEAPQLGQHDAMLAPHAHQPDAITP
jgi:crotonobetainyl-CoA:carnitine CoA-transferase CaiB-like acyl-CoA transferase